MRILQKDSDGPIKKAACRVALLFGLIFTLGGLSLFALAEDPIGRGPGPANGSACKSELEESIFRTEGSKVADLVQSRGFRDTADESAHLLSIGGKNYRFTVDDSTWMVRGEHAVIAKFLSHADSARALTPGDPQVIVTKDQIGALQALTQEERSKIEVVCPRLIREDGTVFFVTDRILYRLRKRGVANSLAEPVFPEGLAIKPGCWPGMGLDPEGQDGFYLTRISNNTSWLDTLKASNELNKSGDLAYAEPETIYQASLEDVSGPAAAAEPSPDSTASAPNCSLPTPASDWHITTMQVREAWQKIPPEYRHDVYVAIFDTGLDYNHPGLDQNKVIGGGDYLASPPHAWTYAGTDYPIDTEGHGTAVAGIVAGKTIEESNWSTTGICPWALLVPYRIIGATNASFIQAISDFRQLVRNKNSKGIVNMSFGGVGNWDQAVMDEYSQTYSGTDLNGRPWDILFVGGAGNFFVIESPNDSYLKILSQGQWHNGQTPPNGPWSISERAWSGPTPKYYPGTCPEVIAVGGIDEHSHWVGFSTDGVLTDNQEECNPNGVRWVAGANNRTEVVGPTTNIWTLDLVGKEGQNDLCQPSATCDPRKSHLYPDAQGNYTAFFNGTSASAPMVSGVAALIRSKYPDLTAEEVRTLIWNGADQQDSTAWDFRYGVGTVNANLSLPLQADLQRCGCGGGHPYGSFTQADWNCTEIFRDVPSNSLNGHHYDPYLNNALRYLNRLNIVQGFQKKDAQGNVDPSDPYIYFNPNRPLNRAEFAALLCRARKFQDEKGDTALIAPYRSVHDVNWDTDWFRGYAARALQEAWMATAACPDNPVLQCFNPSGPVTRADAIKMLVTAWGLALPPAAFTLTSGFSDVSGHSYTGLPGDPNNYMAYVVAAENNHCLSAATDAYGGNFSGNYTLTRGEAAKWIYKFIAWQKDVDGSNGSGVYYSGPLSADATLPNPTTAGLQVNILAPSGGESLTVNNSYTVQWTASGSASVASVDLLYSIDGGGAFSVIQMALGNTGSYSWTVPNQPTDRLVVKVTAHGNDGSTSSGVSSGLARIVTQCTKPLAPTLTYTYYPGDGSFILNWTNLQVNQYEIQESTNSGFSTTTSYFTSMISYLFTGKATGIYYYRLRAKNDCGWGNFSNSVVVSVTAYQPPAGLTYVNPSADNATNVATNVLLQWSASSPSGNALTYTLYFCQCDSSTVSDNMVVYHGSATSYALTGLPMGRKMTWRVKVNDDRNGEVIGPIWHFTTIPDTTPPTGSISIDSGAATTDSLAVTLNLTCTDNQNGQQLYMKFSTDNAHWPQYAVPFQTAYPFYLRDYYSGFGPTYTVYVRFYDEAGNASAVYSDSITYSVGGKPEVWLRSTRYRDLADAMCAAQSGDTIYLTEGTAQLPGQTYLWFNGTNQEEGIVVKAGVKVMGMGATKTKLLGLAGVGGFSVLLMDGASIEGLTLDANGGYGVCFTKNGTVSQCTIQGAVAADGSPRSAITDVGKMDPAFGTGNRVDTCLIKTSACGIELYHDAGSAIVYNCTIVGMSAHGLTIHNTSSAYTVKNLVVTGSGSFGITANGSYTIQYCDSYGNGTNYSPSGIGSATGNASVDPLYTNAGAGDYSLQALSPCVNTGCNVGLPFYGSAPDKGAFERSLTGKLQITTNRSDAAFRVLGPTANYSGTGTQWSQAGLAPGYYFIIFNSIANLVTPWPRSVLVNNPSSYAAVSVAYSPDTTPASGTMLINNGRPFCSSTSVTLQLDFSDADSGLGTGSQMCFSNDGATYSAPIAYASTASWTLTSGDGLKTVYAKVKDAAGNWCAPVTAQVRVVSNPVWREVPTAYGTVQAAVDAANYGDIVHLLPGTHTEAGSIVLKSGLRIQGSGAEQTTLSCSSGDTTFFIQNATEIEIDGLTLLGSTYGINASNCTKLIVSNCVFQSMGNISWKNTFGGARNQARFYGCLFHMSQVRDTDIAGSDLYFTNCTFYDSRNSSMVACADPANQTIQGTRLNIADSIFFDSGTASAIWRIKDWPGFRSVFSSYNDFYNLSQVIVGTDQLDDWLGAGVVQVAPVFLDPVNGNFHLSDTSPLLHAGDPDPRWNNRDGSRNQMGAYGGPEYRRVPIASLVSEPASLLTINQTIALDASASVGVTANLTQYNWDLDGDGVPDYGPFTTPTLDVYSPEGGVFVVGVRVTDANGYSADATVTLTIVDNAPVAPENPISPANGAVGQPASVTLQWQFTTDMGDALTYDLAFGTSSVPPSYATGLSTATYSAGPLEPDTTYYWRITARDQGGQQTPSPVWSFHTAQWTPGAPTNMRIGYDKGNGTILLGWGDGNAHATSFTVQRRDVTAAGTFQTIGTTTGLSWIDHPPLIGGEQYGYQLIGSNAFGSSSPSSEVTYTLPNPPQGGSGYPTITACAPNVGGVNTPQTIHVTGANFLAGGSLFVGGRECMGVTFVNSTTISATVPPLDTAGLKDVVLIQADRSAASLTQGYQVVGAPEYVTQWAVYYSFPADANLTDQGNVRGTYPCEGDDPSNIGRPWAYASATAGGYREALDWGKIMGNAANVNAYALTYVYVPVATNAVLHIGSQDGVAVWLNGANVLTSTSQRAYAPDQNRVGVTLPQGWSRLLLEIYNQDGVSYLSCKISDTQGLAIPGIQFALVNPNGCVFANPRTFVAGPAMLEARTYPAYCTYKDKIYVFGGANATGTVLDTMEVFDPVTNSWTSGAAMPVARRAGVAVPLGGKIYLIGGSPDMNNTVLYNRVDIYDPVNNAWSTGPALNTARAQFAGGEVGGKIVVTGGWASGGVTGSTEVLASASSASWAAGANAPTLRDRQTAFSWNGKLYLTSGQYFNGTQYGITQVYDPVANSWTTGGSLAEVRSAAAATTCEGAGVCAGGWSNSGGYSGRTELYNASANTWSTFGFLATARQENGTAAINGRLYVFGGRSTSANALNMMEVSPVYALAGIPRVDQISPAVRTQANGGNIGLTGWQLDKATQVTFDGIAATALAHQGTAGLTCTSPAHSAGIVDVSVKTNQGFTITLPGAYRYNAPPTGMNPGTAASSASDPSPITDGPILISPANGIVPLSCEFEAAVADMDGSLKSFQWDFGDGASATTTENKTSHTYTAVGSFAVTLTVTDSDGDTSTFTDTVRVLNPGVYLTQVIPAVEVAAPSYMVTVKGYNFVTGAAVAFGGVPASEVFWVDQNTLHVRPPSLAVGTYNVTVVNPGGVSANLTSGYRIVSENVLSSANPSFETDTNGDGVPDLWTASSGTGGLFSLTVVDGVAGLNCLRVDSTSQVSYVTSALVAPVQGHPYVLYAYTKALFQNALVRLEILDTSNNLVASLGQFTQDRGWSLHALAFTAPAGGVKVKIMGYGVFLADDLIMAGPPSSMAPTEASPYGLPSYWTKGTGTSVNVNYIPGCNATGETVYWGSAIGRIPSALQWTNQACSRGNSGLATFDPGTPGPGQFFYCVVVANNGSQEGSYGKSSSGQERPQATGLSGCSYTLDLTGACQASLAGSSHESVHGLGQL
jgi:N-acetylneuraminic acid mutarotase